MIKLISRHWLLQVSLLALVYFVVGKIALLLAVSPGFASPIWPSSGIAISALLIFGINRWPGCFLGSFLINLSVGGAAYAAPPALAIATGSTLAVVTCALLVRRFIQYPKSFYLEKDILLFLIICGPVAALISSTWNTLFLLALDRVHPVNFFINWLHWFIGDATGAIIFSPLALVFSSKARKYWMGSISKVLIPLAVCSILVVFALQYINKIESKQVMADFHKQTELSSSLLDKDLHSFQALLGTLQSFFDNSNSVSRDEFKNFTSHLLLEAPEIQALLWVPVSSEKNPFFKPQYVEPFEKNASILYLDLGKNPEYKNLILTARRSTYLVTSPPISLNNTKNVSMALAINNPSGVLIGVIDPKILMSFLSSFSSDGSYRLQVTDVSNPLEKIPVMATWDTTQHDPYFRSQLKWNRELKFGNRTWNLEVIHDPTLKPTVILNTAVFLISSLIFAFLTCTLLLTTANRIITTQAMVEQKTLHLQELNLQLEKASKTKTEFLANMSHEIRTPLNIIVGMADLLEEAPLQEHQRHYLEISRRAGDNLLNIINDILDISKIESGLISLEMTSLNLPEIVSEVVDMFSPKAKSKNIDFRLKIDKSAKNIYLGDPTRTRQILSNLVSNALKFTAQGFIEIRVSSFSDATISGNILFEVADSGIGIAPEVIPTLFKPFTQADSTITRKFGGTGLGLSICKRLTEMMNGSIGVKSEVGKGSTFHFTLTLPLVRSADQKVASSPNNKLLLEKVQIPSLKILIVDDADDNRLLLRAYLEGTNHRISEADNGLQALELYKKQEFDVILMDMQMPGMDGFTAVRKIRSFEAENARTPARIWALTAYALKNEVQRSFDVGCERHLTKPLRKQELLREIASYNQSRH